MVAGCCSLCCLLFGVCCVLCVMCSVFCVCRVFVVGVLYVACVCGV